MKYYLSTLADIISLPEPPYYQYVNRTAQKALDLGMGIEAAELGVTDNLDEGFVHTLAMIREKQSVNPDLILHGPFNELAPCAIDPKIRAVAWERFTQAYEAAAQLGARKIVFHGGYIPHIYFPEWFTEKSILFWNAFLKANPKGPEICLENVLEERPSMLAEIVQNVEDPRLKLCLDAGHANLSGIHPMEWAEAFGPWLSHLHIHNNPGVIETGSRGDRHSALGKGSIPMKEFLLRCIKLNPEVTITLETLQLDESIEWLKENHLI